MKNTLFYKITAVAIGSLLSLSGTAFASTYRTTEITLTNTLGNVETLVAQVPLQLALREVPAFAKSVSVAESALGNALAAAQSQAITGSGKTALAKSIAQAKTLIGNATAISGSTAISDKKAIAVSLSKAETVLGDALAIAQSDAISGPGKPAIATSLATAKTAVGNATAIAQSSVR
ncbi:hypothetical protein NIES592_21810 [Fischerella major NIES-592]|uniref:Uncharacterized protein n=2 Tax=Fischerella TaxID=1190 RepID=A0A1U7GTR8_9CYAN|nr:MULTISPECIES: hypothetical protein [Fischerella]OKH11345.1 hypothetical protein NIES592_21810 [Fischerella major NIES-592]PMB43342.1 hypothetical protein CEN41_13180 [Fischerella thermalis CCMEE 5330]BAU08889.1 hypothetical protein FIS3754_48480 [Fischerella sp. NIES-3754]BCX06365.1 MAG: hypothetical protein KatS3mg066_0224 [Fischerella sp.]